MSSRNSEFEHLIAGLANRDLTQAECHRLSALAHGNPQQQAELRSVSALHELFDHEVELQREVLTPTNPGEEAQESWQRLSRQAAVAEQSLRARLSHAPLPVLGHINWRRRSLQLAAIAAVLTVGVFLFTRRSTNPGLISERPGQEVLGQGVVLLAAEISAEHPTILWLPVVNASRYEVKVVDADDKVLFTGPAQAKSTRWDFTAEQFALLKSAKQPLILRIRACDGDGLPVATSGDLKLQVR